MWSVVSEEATCSVGPSTRQTANVGSSGSANCFRQRAGQQVPVSSWVSMDPTECQLCACHFGMVTRLLGVVDTQ